MLFDLVIARCKGAKDSKRHTTIETQKQTGKPARIHHCKNKQLSLLFTTFALSHQGRQPLAGH